MPSRLTIAVAAGLFATAVVTPAVGAETSWPGWDAAATNEFRSWVADDGEFVWSNGVFQSRGANTDGLHHEDYWGPIMTGGELPIDDRDDVERHLTWGAFGVDRWATDGDHELPLDDVLWPAFTGELAELRLATDSDELFIRLRYTSMPAPDAQIATLAFGAEGAATDTPPTAWPHAAGVTSPWSVAVTTWGTAGTVTTAGGQPVDLRDVGGEVRTGDHVVEVRVPRSLLPSGPWRLTGGAGLADPDDPSQYWAVPAGAATATSPGSGSTLRGGPGVWSLLFADDDPWVFTARSEADLLAGGDVTAASLTVDPADLDARRSLAPEPRSGRLARFHDSAFDFGDGIVKGEPAQSLGPLELPPELPLDDAGRNFEYTGRLQPYGMFVPPAYHQRTGPWPLIVYLHGLNNFYYEPFGTLPNLDEQMTSRGFLFAGLLGRGDLSYLGRGELDVREVMVDIATHYDVDPDRIYLMGHSMGSIGSHNVATRNPDLFAAGAPAEITASDDLIANLRHVPWMMVGGVEDPLDPGASSEETTYALMSELGYDVTFYRYLTKTHESSSIYDTLPAMLDLFDRSRRVADPAEFTYIRKASDDHPDLGLVHDHAYQASNLQFADDTRPQTIAVSSSAIPHAPLDPAAATRTDQQVDEGGLSNRSAAQKLVTVPGYGADVAVRNAARVSLDNVGAITLNLGGLALRPVAGMSIEVATTDAVALSLAGAGSAVTRVEVDGAPVEFRLTSGVLGVDVPAGDHVVVIAVAGEPTDAVDGSDVPLPATGGGGAARGLAGLLSVFAVTGARRRAARG